MEKRSIPSNLTKCDLTRLGECFSTGIAMWQMLNRDAQRTNEADRIFSAMEDYRVNVFMPMFEKYRSENPVNPEEEPIKIMRLVDEIAETEKDDADTNKTGESSSKTDKTNKKTSSDDYVPIPYDKI